jgi:hypothetical protein
LADGRGIGIIGMGSDGTHLLWDGQYMEKGNHIRWFFNSLPSGDEASDDGNLFGFPQLGFELFRRESAGLKNIDFTHIGDLGPIWAQKSKETARNLQSTEWNPTCMEPSEISKLLL